MALCAMDIQLSDGNFYSFMNCANRTSIVHDSLEKNETGRSMESDPSNKKVIISKDLQEILNCEDIAVEGFSITEESVGEEGGFSIALETKKKDENIEKTSSLIRSRLEDKGYSVDKDKIILADGIIMMFVDTGTGKSKSPTEDDIQEVVRLKNMYRANRIDKSQFVGGIASLYSMGLLSSAQVNRLTKGL